MADLLAALLIGILGAGHCLAMCGSLTAAIGVSNNLIENLAYNLGRITSYTIAGYLVGLVGYWLASWLFPFLITLRILSGIILILLGLYIAKWYLGLSKLEQSLQFFWRLIAPLAQKSLNKKGILAKYVSGNLWGWLPCGLVYSTLTWAATKANPIDSAMIMLAFGSGTLPTLLLGAILAKQIKSIINHKLTRHISGLIIILLGVHNLYLALMQIKF